MRKSLFKKYLATSLLIVVTGFLVLGFLLMFFVQGFWQNNKKSQLIDNSRDVVSLVKYDAVYKDGDITISESKRLDVVFNAFVNAIDCDIFFCGKDGLIEYSTGTSSFDYKNKKVNNELLDKIKDSNGSYYNTEKISGIMDESCLFAAEPLVINDDVYGYCFSVTPSSNVNELMVPLMSIFAYSAAAALAILFTVVGLYSFRLVHPLKEMSDAAKKFARGDLSSRVKVQSEDEIGELANAFNNMADSLTSAENMRRSFIANVSHELKTPMTTIGGFIDGILDGTVPQEKERDYLTKVSEEVKRLSRLVTSMLSLSRIDAGELKVKKSEFNLSTIIFQTLFSFEHLIEEKNIEIRGLEELPTLMVDGDSDLIHQVVYNLFENATKFTNKGGYIEIHHTETATKTSVAIINSGYGIPPEDLPMIFDKFYKTDKSRNEDKKGMGLGLYLVKTIMLQHGGDINVTSDLNKYTAFTFWLPKTMAVEHHLDKVAEINRAEEDT